MNLRELMPVPEYFCKGVSSETDKFQFPIKERDRVTEIREVSQDDVDAFSKLTGDHNPIHTTNGGKTKAIVHGALLNGLVSGVIGTRLPGPGTMVVLQELNFPNPCFAGEQVTVTVEIESLRKIITCRFWCTVNRDKDLTVLHGYAKLVQMKKNSGKM
ncbi:hypothetical protein ANN_24882 [Periplaneta americana]|uniref:MaoC-like domain-containing protein n=1 Tax=Periplaneta americana TaxID=6978 RepID=A0ABQ8S043_PERAM|nr:hypothetical protein ANN_24882 [Periplaneta americana]